MVDHFISYNIHNGIIGIKHEGRHVKNKVNDMQVGAIQLMVLLFVFREQSKPVKFVRARMLRCLLAVQLIRL